MVYMTGLSVSLVSFILLTQLEKYQLCNKIIKRKQERLARKIPLYFCLTYINYVCFRIKFTYVSIMTKMCMISTGKFDIKFFVNRLILITGFFFFIERNFLSHIKLVSDFVILNFIIFVHLFVTYKSKSLLNQKYHTLNTYFLLLWKFSDSSL